MMKDPVKADCFQQAKQADEYFSMIKRPMCYSEIRSHLKHGKYDSNVEDFISDLMLPMKNIVQFYTNSKFGDTYGFLKPATEMLSKTKKFINSWRKFFRSNGSIHATIVGIGVDLSVGTVQKLSSIGGCRYMSVASAEEFESSIANEFAFDVTPIAFDITVALDTTQKSNVSTSSCKM